jgi:long-chain acyl-CoA synthetase
MTMSLNAEFGLISDLVRQTAHEAPQRVALTDGERSLSYREFDETVDRVAASLQRDGVKPRETIAICATSSLEYIVTFLGALRAGIVVAPLAPSATPKSLADMARDCEARLLFLDAATQGVLSEVDARVPRIALDGWPLPALGRRA